MITGISLRNWKSHMETDMDFSPGVNAILGINGSGKSSVMQAISFAFFGTFPALASKKVVLDDLIMRKPHEEKEATVEIRFRAGGKEYSVRRALRRGKGTSDAELRESGRLVEATPAGVTREVERILQIDYDLYCRAVYSEQNGLDNFLNVPKGARMKQIDDMLKLDRFEKAREGAVSIKNRITVRREEKARMLEGLRGRDIKGRIESLGKEISHKEREAGDFRKELATARKGLETLGKEHEEAEGRTEALRETLSSANSRVIFLKERIKEMKESEKGIENVTKELKVLEEFLGKEPEKKLGKMQAEVENVKKQIYSIDSLLRESGKGLEELRKAGHKCPVCESDLTAEKKGQIERGKETHIKEMERRLSLLKKGQMEAAARMEEFSERLEEYEAAAEKLRGLKENEGKGKELGKELEAMMAGAAQAAERIKKESVKEKELAKSLQEIFGKARELEERLRSIEEIVKEKGRSLGELNAQAAMIKTLEKDLVKFAGVGEALSGFVDVLKATQDQLREEFLKTVNYIMNNVWEELYPYGDYREIRMAVDRDYVLQLKGSAGWAHVDTVSGGERSLAALALRIAFSLAFTPNLKWLILDEPTHNLDSASITHLGEVLRDRMEGIVDQVFLITHEEALSDYITGKVHVFERDKANDGATVLKAADK